MAMAPHSSTLAWKIPWMEEPGGLPSMGSHRVRHDWSDLAAAAALATSQISSLQKTCWTCPLELGNPIDVGWNASLFKCLAVWSWMLPMLLSKDSFTSMLWQLPQPSGLLPELPVMPVWGHQCWCLCYRPLLSYIWPPAAPSLDMAGPQTLEA